MKIAINKCYGGFGISYDAILELIKLDSKLISVSDESEWNQSEDRWESFKDGFDRNTCYNILRKDGQIYSDNSSNYKNRTDLKLIEVIEKLGEEKASSSLAKIKIIEIPDDVDWFIDDYDGIESIREKHRSW